MILFLEERKKKKNTLLCPFDGNVKNFNLCLRYTLPHSSGKSHLSFAASISLPRAILNKGVRWSRRSSTRLLPRIAGNQPPFRSEFRWFPLSALLTSLLFSLSRLSAIVLAPFRADRRRPFSRGTERDDGSGGGAVATRIEI